MGFESFLFYVFALVTLWAAGMVITRRNPVHAVLFLVLAFFSSAALWLLLEAEFLGIVLVLVYVGAVMVLFLFVVMMLDIDIAALRAGFIRALPLGLIVAGVMAVEIFLVVGPANFGLSVFPAPEAAAADASNARDLGLLLYTVYVYPVEIAAVILLVAIIAAIHLALRRRPDNKSVDPARQVRVKRGSDRVRLVKMAPEARESFVRVATTEKRENP
ncbi:NADH-ubiquinone/plastoquinone oxidoreductase chain 6 [Thiorhodococcus drewsii AZ1]|uniref:NADH-quinone oxidoreductase subunit J n=1 Tax=Thiorhodococcus drewsii AZ1 TaxID=765913 RepID=G2E756_9GAMM|nr:NADH-quinone oxidoreductase subunit J [Thiorhodococcus drewsii]EGV28087.1 NADH-ubiquinone/plastoquinone oxidoreductase chain 6 [Thiorhodococcus drewsii AZ1]